MTNKDVAKLLYEIAELLELTDVNRFEVIAYQNAARAVENYPGDIGELYRNKGTEGLREIEGVGATISKNIAEYIETGKSGKKERLRKKIPAIKLKINQIPGVGPKTTNKIYQAIKPKSITDLAEKIHNPKLQKKLSGISIKEKTIQNILKKINLKDKGNISISYKIASPIARKFLEYIKKTNGVKKADIAGSLRRKQKTIRDIDIVVGAAVPETQNIINSFVNYPGVKSVIVKGTTKASVYSKAGIRVDLELLPLDCYGNLLQHFTGSKEHNVKLRTYANSIEMSVSEHGIRCLRRKSQFPIAKSQTNLKSQRQNSKLIKCQDEECVYTTLGMEYIPPELRNGTDEIELALKHRRADS